MSWKKRLRPIIDIAMTVSMPVLMAYELVGAVLHEWLGIVIFLLFLAHHALNFSWIKAIPKGRYNMVRSINLAVNLLLLAVMFLLPISGIMMSKHVFSFVDFGAGAGFARTAHLLVSYWGFLLMSFHIGLHWDTMRGSIRKKQSKAAGLHRLPAHLTAVAAIGYGGYAFIRRGFHDYLFLKTQFVFYDFSEPLVFFLIDFFTIMAMAACLGYYLARLLRKTAHKKQPLQSGRKETGQ